MLKIKTEAKIGIIVLVTIALVIWGINFLKGKNILKRSDVFYAVFEDIKGIDVSAPVMISGYQVGLINTISFAKGELDRLIVAFTVDHKYDIPLNSTVELFSADLLGSKALRILPSGEASYHQYGDTLKSSIQNDMISQLSSEFIPLKEKAESAIEELDSLIASLNYVLDEKTSHALQESIANLESLSSGMAKQMGPGGDLQKTFTSLNNFTKMLSDNNEKLDAVFSNLESISDSIAKANVSELLNSINKTFTESSELMARINEGEGSLGLLASNDSLYLNINSSIQSLDLLLKDLNENPKKYVHFSLFGRKDR
jgi:phospholipid/cholesterol/gamma-HCH transport system substrate-binding protein